MNSSKCSKLLNHGDTETRKFLVSQVFWLENTAKDTIFDDRHVEINQETNTNFGESSCKSIIALRELEGHVPRP